MIKLIVTRPDGDLLWRGDAQEASFAVDGVFTFKGAAQPVLPPYSIAVVDSEGDEDDGSQA